MSEHPNNIGKHGSKICCDALLAFLKAKNASAHVVDAFEVMLMKLPLCRCCQIVV